MHSASSGCGGAGERLELSPVFRQRGGGVLLSGDSISSRAADEETDGTICWFIPDVKVKWASWNAVIWMIASQIMTEAPGYVEIKHTYLSSQKTTALNFTFKPPAAPSFCSMRVRRCSNVDPGTTVTLLCDFTGTLHHSASGRFESLLCPPQFS